MLKLKLQTLITSFFLLRIISRYPRRLDGLDNENTTRNTLGG